MTTVREFVNQSYQLVSAQSPTVPLHGDDELRAIQCLNRLLKNYAANGLMLTIARTETCPLFNNQAEVTVGPADFVPTPNIPVGRLANLNEAWLELTGVRYPLIYKSKEEFNQAWLYEPLKGLPRFIIAFPETKIMRLRLYPAASQEYTFFIRGKFQATVVNANDTIDQFPDYFELFLTLAVARQIAMFKGRMSAWTPELKEMYIEAKQDMEGASEVNLAINGDEESLLNGSWRVKAGI